MIDLIDLIIWGTKPYPSLRESVLEIDIRINKYKDGWNMPTNNRELLIIDVKKDNDGDIND